MGDHANLGPDARIFAALAQPIALFAASRGLDPFEWLAPLGVTQGQLADRDARIPYQTLIVLWQGLLERFPDEPLGMNYA